MLQEYAFKYGMEKVHFKLNPDRVVAELTIKECPVLPDPEAAIRHAIRHPIGTPPLKEIVKPGETVVFIVNDPTRVANSHVFMPILVQELNEAGIKDEDMTILFSLGTHRLMTPEEMAATVGPEVAGRIKMFNSDAKDPSQFTYLGTTSRGTPVYFNTKAVEADHIICTGSIVYHFFAGFGGGRKAMLPGIAAYETIRHNHSMLFDPGAGLGKLDGNPVYEDQIEGAEMCRPSFLLNVVLNENKEFLQVFAGDYIQAHREGCRFVESIYGTPLARRGDLVIASCGGYPKDINVYQMQKTMDNAWLAVRDGGVIIILAECREGAGSDLYLEWMRRYRTPERIEEEIRKNFQIGAHKAYAVTRLMKKAQFILVSSLDDELARTLLFTPAKDMDTALALAYQRLGPDPDIVLMPQGSLTVPLVK